MEEEGLLVCRHTSERANGRIVRSRTAATVQPAFLEPLDDSQVLRNDEKQNPFLTVERVSNSFVASVYGTR